MDEPRIFSTDGDGIDTLTFDAFGTPARFVGADLLIGPNEAFPTNEALSSMTDEEFDRIPECQCVAAVLDPWSRSEHWIPSRNEVPASEEWSEEREAAFRAAVRTEAVKRGATHILWHVGITRSETEPLPPPVSGGEHQSDDEDEMPPCDDPFSRENSVEVDAMDDESNLGITVGSSREVGAFQVPDVMHGAITYYLRPDAARAFAEALTRNLELTTTAADHTEGE